MPGRCGSPPAMPLSSKAWTSVPRACPGAGCTTRPAGLSTTSRCSSSYGTTRFISCGSSVLARGAGGSNSSSSPPSSLWLFARDRPSTSTPPLLTRRSASAREPISGNCERKRSSRSPADSGGTCRRVTGGLRPARLALGERERGEEDDDAGHDEAVGEVERRPPAQVEEVCDVAEPHPIEQVRHAASDHEPE